MNFFSICESKFYYLTLHFFGSIISQGYNLVGSITGCGFSSSSGDQSDINPMVGPLEYNDGSNETHTLLTGSTAIDGGNPSGCKDENGAGITIDQRSEARPQGTNCDIGAYEFTPSLYSDDFEDSDASDWTANKGTWTVLGGALTGNHNGKADIISPFQGCTNCAVEADLQLLTQGDRVSLLAWYVDKKNLVELVLFDDKDKVVLKQKVGGSVLSKGKFQMQIDPYFNYNVKVSFDGTNFVVSIDGLQILTVLVATTPSGRVGFRIKATSDVSAAASFREIAVY